MPYSIKYASIGRRINCGVNDLKDEIIGYWCCPLVSLENTLSWVGVGGLPGPNVKPVYLRIVTEVHCMYCMRSTLLLEKKPRSLIRDLWVW